MDDLVMPYPIIFRPTSINLSFMTRVLGPGPAYYQGAIPPGVTTVMVTWNGAGRVVCQYRTASMTSTLRLGELIGGASDIEVSKMFRISTESEGAYVQFQYTGGPVSDQTEARIGVTVIPMGEVVP